MIISNESEDRTKILPLSLTLTQTFTRSEIAKAVYQADQTCDRLIRYYAPGNRRIKFDEAFVCKEIHDFFEFLLTGKFSRIFIDDFIPEIAEIRLYAKNSEIIIEGRTVTVDESRRSVQPWVIICSWDFRTCS